MIEAQGLEVTFRRGLTRRRPIRALDGFSLRVEPGEVIGVVGPNGSGKSTAMHCLLGLIRPDRGTVTVLGRRPRPGSRVYDRLAYLPEEPHYHLYLTVEETVRFYAGLGGGRPDAGEIRRAIERVGLWEARELLLRKCSKGMKQRAGIAALLVRRPDLVLLDEPMRGLDPATVVSFRGLLQEMNRQGTTIVFNTHILPEVEALCTRVAFVKAGRLVRDEPLEAVLDGGGTGYLVEVEARGPAPEAMEVIAGGDGGVHRGLVAAERVAELFATAAAGGARVLSCTLRKSTLERAYFEVLGEPPPAPPPPEPHGAETGG